MPSFFTREAAAPSCVERGLEGARGILAPPARVLPRGGEPEVLDVVRFHGSHAATPFFLSALHHEFANESKPIPEAATHTGLPLRLRRLGGGLRRSLPSPAPSGAHAPGPAPR